MRLPLLLILLSALAACGTRGPLELPPGPPPTPVFGSKTPASAQQTLPDNSNNPAPQ